MENEKKIVAKWFNSIDAKPRDNSDITTQSKCITKISLTSEMVLRVCNGNTPLSKAEFEEHAYKLLNCSDLLPKKEVKADITETNFITKFKVFVKAVEKHNKKKCNAKQINAYIDAGQNINAVEKIQLKIAMQKEMNGENKTEKTTELIFSN